MPLGSLTFLAATLAAVPAYALRCGTELVDVGDTRAELHAACGEPRLAWRQTLGFRAGPEPLAVERSVAREVWLYLPGPNDFARLVVIDDGFVVAIEQGRYGRDYRQRREACAGPLFDAKPGAWAPELELLCGVPDRRTLLERRSRPVVGTERGFISRQIEVEEWRYDFPALRRTARLLLEDGRLTWLGWEDLEERPGRP